LVVAYLPPWIFFSGNLAVIERQKVRACCPTDLREVNKQTVTTYLHEVNIQTVTGTTDLHLVNRQTVTRDLHEDYKQAVPTDLHDDYKQTVTTDLHGVKKKQLQHLQEINKQTVTFLRDHQIKNNARIQTNFKILNINLI